MINGYLSSEASGTLGLLPASRVGFRGICPELAGGLRVALRFMRKEVEGAFFAFLECGIPENGIARVRCSGCGHDFFVAFSCRTCVVCPNCTTRRSLWFGEKVRELVHPPASAGSRCGSSPSSTIHMRSLRSSNISGNRSRTPRP